jgi:tagatose 1,6-diphosphate aldolase
MDEESWESACAELDAEIPVPWVILSAGVNFDTFVRQAEVACRAGASGVLAGRAVWKESVGMSLDERRIFYATVAARRLADLKEVVDSYGRPWREPSVASSGSDWYV